MMVPPLPTAKATSPGISTWAGALAPPDVSERSTPLSSFVVGTVVAAFQVDPSVVRTTVPPSPVEQPILLPANATPFSETLTPDDCAFQVAPASVLLRIKPWRPTTKRTLKLPVSH